MYPPDSVDGWSELGLHNEEWQDSGDSPRGNRPHQSANQPEIPIELPTLPTSQAQQPDLEKLESRQQQSLSPAAEMLDSSALKAIAPVNATDLPVREALSDIRLDNLPTAITIPGITERHSSSVDRGLTILEFPQPNELDNAVDQGANSVHQMSHRSMEVTAMPSNISARDSEAADVLTHAPSSINPRSLKQLSPHQNLSNRMATSFAEQPQSLTSEPTVDGAAVQPSTVSFRPKTRTDVNTRSAERLAGSEAPNPISQSHSHARLPIAATPMPMASANNMPTSPMIAPQATSRMTEEIARLRRTVSELAAQVTAQQDFQRSAAPIVLPPPVQIVERPVSPTKPPQAFWERSYLSRLYRWSRR